MKHRQEAVENVLWTAVSVAFWVLFFRTVVVEDASSSSKPSKAFGAGLVPETLGAAERRDDTRPWWSGVAYVSTRLRLSLTDPIKLQGLSRCLTRASA